MKEKDLTSKELLVQKLGMEFDEVTPIFSEETLSTMVMSHVVGGADDTNPGCTVNPGCSYSGCSSNTSGDSCKTKECSTKIISCGGGSSTKVASCGTTTKPTEKPTEPTTDKPTAKPAGLL